MVLFGEMCLSQDLGPCASVSSFCGDGLWCVPRLQGALLDPFLAWLLLLPPGVWWCQGDNWVFLPLLHALAYFP